MYVTHGRITVGALVSVLFVCGSVQARQSPPFVPNGQSASPQITNRSLLEQLNWSPAQRGPLLVIAPDWKNASDGEIFFPVRESSPLGQPGPEGYKPANLFAYLNRKEMPVGSLTVAAPLNQYVLRYTNLPEPDLLREIAPAQRLKFLLATLTTAQWKRLMSEDGLGIKDLDRSQKPLFAAAFPIGTRILQAEPGSEFQPGKTTDITPSQLDALHLRLTRRLKLGYLVQGEKNSTLSFDVTTFPPISQDGKPVYWVQYPPEELEQSSLPSVAHGVDLMPVQPNRLKASDIDYTLPAFDLPVSITGVKQVGDLIDRLKTATGLELYADMRIAELPVYCRAGSGNVRCGDLMKALALGVTGAYRRVSSGSTSVYILTDDLVGMGTRQTIIGDWLRRTGLQASEANKALERGIMALDATHTAPWAEEESRIPSAAIQEKMAKPVIGTESRYFPVTELPATLQAKVRDQVSTWNNRKRDENDLTPQRKIRADMVQLTSELQFALNLTSGETMILDSNMLNQVGGDIDIVNNAVRDQAENPSAYPLRLSAKAAKERILCVTVKTTDQAKQVAQIANAHGLNQVMLTCDLSTSQEALAGWVSAIQGTVPTVKVSLRIRPFWLAENLVDHEEKDILSYDFNLLGETSAQFVRRRKKEGPSQIGTISPYWATKEGYWIDIADKKNTSVVLQRISALVATSGIFGVYLTDLLPPGYNFLIRESQSEFDPEGYYGYTLSQRLALIREKGVDPIDLAPYGESVTRSYSGGNSKSVNTLLPFLPDYGPWGANGTRNGVPGIKLGAKDTYGRWNMIRYRQASALRDQVAEAIAHKAENREVWTEANWGQINMVATPGGGLVIPVIDWEEAKNNDTQLPDVPNMGSTNAPAPINYLMPFHYIDDVRLKDRGIRAARRFFPNALYWLAPFLVDKAPDTKPLIPVPMPTKPARGFIIDVSDYSTDEVAEFLSDLSVVP